MFGSFVSLRSWAMAATLSIGAIGSGAGCAGSAAALNDQNRVLQMEVAQLKAERRRARRELRDLERQRLLEKESARESAGPTLPVQVLAPPASESESGFEAAPESGDESGIAAAAAGEPGGDLIGEGEGEVAEVGLADDGVEVVYVGEAARASAARPVLRLRQPAASEVRAVPAAEVPVRSDGAPERLAVTSGPVPRLPPAAEAPPRQRLTGVAETPADEYQRYLAALKAGNHRYAIVGFRAFIEQHPKHDLADNAQYWLAEAFYDQKQFEPALAEFRRVITQFPRGNKVAGAMLKSAYCELALGHARQGREVLQLVAERYPKSNVAALAANKLAELKAGE